MSSNGKALMLGGLATAAAVCMYLYRSYRSDVDSSDDLPEKVGADVQGGDATASAGPSSSSSPTALNEKMATLKSLYTATQQEGMKYVKEKEMELACGKFTECLELLKDLDQGTMQRDRIILLNNRSSMYERVDKLEEALGDIGVVLEMSPKHNKCRVRRARIYEKQGHTSEALHEYAVAMVVEQNQGTPPLLIENITLAEKVQEMNKQLSMKDAMQLYESIRNNDSRKLQARMGCNDHFDICPAYHLYKKKMVGADRDVLLASLKEATAQGGEQGSLAWVNAVLDLAWHDICAGAYKRGFSHVKENVTKARALLKQTGVDLGGGEVVGEGEGDTGDKMTDDDELKQSVSELLLLAGSEMQLRYCTNRAVEYFEEVCDLLPGHFEASIRLADCLTESGSIARAEAIYTELTATYIDGAANVDVKAVLPPRVTSLDALPAERRRDLFKAWVLCHRNSLQKFRNEDGEWRSNAISDAMSAISQILELTEFLEDDETKACRVCALLQTVQILSDTKRQIGQSPTKEDAERVKYCIREARKIAPDHLALPFLEADLLNADGKTEEAIRMCDECIRLAEPGDGFPYIMKANISQIFMIQSLQQVEAGNRAALPTFQYQYKHIMELYQKALDEEPESIEGIQQMAHLQGMMGDGDPRALEAALEQLERASQLGRNLDEVVNLVTQRNHLRVCIAATKALTNA